MRRVRKGVIGVKAEPEPIRLNGMAVNARIHIARHRMRRRSVGRVSVPAAAVSERGRSDAPTLAGRRRSEWGQAHRLAHAAPTFLSQLMSTD